MTELTARELLVHLFATAVDAVDGRYLVQHWCRENPSIDFTRCVAVGKAAAAMLQGALDGCPSIRQALLITGKNRARAFEHNSKVSIVESAHPIPEQSSLDAGDTLLKYLAGIPGQSSLLVLVSGGASSMVEVLADGVSLEQLQQINHHLLASGKDIRAINAWRKQFSKIKGGGLLDKVRHLRCTQLLISDVPTDDAAVIGSGMLVRSEDKADSDGLLRAMLPDAVQYREHYTPITTHIIGTNEMARRAVADEGAHQQLDCHLHETFINGDAVEQGRRLGQYLHDAPVGVHVWGGETTVKLPDKPGLGGRNQVLALSLAAAVDGIDGVSVLVAGSDGIDGNTPCAGAVVSGRSMRSIRQMGFDVELELNKANAGTVLMASGDLFKPGPTNTNVMDLIIAYKR